MTGPIARSPAQLSSKRSHCGFCVEARDTFPWSKMSGCRTTLRYVLLPPKSALV